MLSDRSSRNFLVSPSKPSSANHLTRASMIRFTTGFHWRKTVGVRDGRESERRVEQPIPTHLLIAEDQNAVCLVRPLAAATRLRRRVHPCDQSRTASSRRSTFPSLHRFAPSAVAAAKEFLTVRSGSAAPCRRQQTTAAMLARSARDSRASLRARSFVAARAELRREQRHSRMNVIAAAVGRGQRWASGKRIASFTANWGEEQIWDTSKIP